MMDDRRFEPIAIVGQGCVLPGALSPAALWDVVSQKKIVYGPVPADRLGITSQQAARHPYASGIVSGFEAVFDPERIPDSLRAAVTHDSVCAWPVHAALQAWEDARSPQSRRRKTGVFVANLSYPTRGHARYAEHHWSGQAGPDPRSTFNSALPPRLISQILDLGGPAFSLDAACASSLYALEIACRRLQSRQLDCAIVAAVNAADNLILHIGFDALKALSPTGQSRPFVKGADGLVPSEGAAAVVLKRLSDVVKRDRVYGVIRGIGLSNDGRRKGLLAPSGEGQKEAMQRAYGMAGLSIRDISYLECHATGTQTGDRVEVSAAAALQAGPEGPALGSLKANTGHLITAAGLASVLKLTEAFRHEALPPTPVAGPLIEAIAESGLRVLKDAEAWPEGARRAGISNFGFGGNNAHLILEQYQGTGEAVSVQLPGQDEDSEVVVCGTGLLAGNDRGVEAVLRRVMNAPVKPAGPCTAIGADPASARTPPKDLLEAEPQQLAIFDTVQEARNAVAPVQADRTGIFTAMGCASDSVRWLVRERIATVYGLPDGSGALEQAKAAIAPPLSAAAVLGAMANMTANRLTYAHDYQGMGFSVSADAASGLAALDLALGSLRAGTLDMAIVAAADFACEPVRAAALRQLSITANPGDQAAAVILKRKTDAHEAGDPVLGTVTEPAWSFAGAECPAILEQAFGTAPGAETVFRLALHANLSVRGLRLDVEAAVTDLSEEATPVEISVAATEVNIGGCVRFEPAPAKPLGDVLRPLPVLFWAAAKDREALA